jgi:hypothetical protein
LDFSFFFRRDIPGKIAVAGGGALGAHFFQLPGVGGFFLPRLCDPALQILVHRRSPDRCLKTGDHKSAVCRDLP